MFKSVVLVIILVQILESVFSRGGSVRISPPIPQAVNIPKPVPANNPVNPKNNKQNANRKINSNPRTNQNPKINSNPLPKQNPKINSNPLTKQNPKINSNPLPKQNPKINSNPLPKQNPKINSNPLPNQNPKINSNPLPKQNPKINPNPLPKQNPKINSNPLPKQNPKINSNPLPNQNPRINSKPLPNQNPNINSNPLPNQNPNSKLKSNQSPPKKCFSRTLNEIGRNFDLKIISRKTWRAINPKKNHEAMKETPYAVIIHHTADPKVLVTMDSCILAVKAIQSYHINMKNWNDIGYNFLICGDGNVYEGRGWDVIGAHAPGHNRFSLGISFIGNYDKTIPNDPSQQAFYHLMDYAVANKKLVPSYTLLGHRDTKKTLCPGSAFYNLIQTWPHYKNDPVCN